MKLPMRGVSPAEFIGTMIGELIVCLVAGWLLCYASERRWFDVPHAAAAIYVLRTVFRG